MFILKTTILLWLQECCKISLPFKLYTVYFFIVGLVHSLNLLKKSRITFFLMQYKKGGGNWDLFCYHFETNCFTINNRERRRVSCVPHSSLLISWENSGFAWTEYLICLWECQRPRTNSVTFPPKTFKTVMWLCPFHTTYPCESTKTQIAGLSNHAEIMGPLLDTTFAKVCQNTAWHYSVWARQLDHEMIDTLERADSDDWELQ